MQDKDIIFK
jgi:hypothetical protein